jgi:hypothetical protein
MPRHGKDTHSRQPSIRLWVTPEPTEHLARVNCRFELYPADYVVLIACATGDQTMFALSDADLC